MDNEKIFFSISQIKVKTAEHLLQEAGIECHIINKMDSAHAGVFGDIELHINAKDADRAKEILKQAEIL